MRNLLFAAAVLFAVSASADTTVYVRGNYLQASLNEGNDPQILFDALNIPDTQSRSGSVKVFRPSDEACEIYCYKSSGPIGLPYGCTISVNIKTRSDETPVDYDGRLVKATLYNVDAAKALFKALALPGIEGPNDVTKAFMTSDKKAAVFCSKSTVPSATPYSCTIWIAVK